MTRHPGRPCRAQVTPYESMFYPGRRRWQYICECGAIDSGHTTEMQAHVAAKAHEGVALGLAVDEDVAEEIDRLAGARAAAADPPSSQLLQGFRW